MKENRESRDGRKSLRVRSEKEFYLLIERRLLEQGYEVLDTFSLGGRPQKRTDDSRLGAVSIS